MEKPRSNNPKVLALYQAVIDLMDQGIDLNAMKVIDITSQAGIGKGTAYDYFASKEDIIAEAILYYITKGTEELYNRLRQTSGFQKKIYTALDWMEENLEKKRSLSQILKISGTSSEVNQKVHGCFSKKKNDKGFHNPDIFFELIISEGIQEGIMKAEKDPFYLKSALLSPALNFLLFLQEGQDEVQITIKEAKHYAYKSVLKLLEIES